MQIRTIQDVNEYNAHRAGGYYAAALAYEWVPETLGAPQSLNLAVDFHSMARPGHRLRVKFIGVDQPRMREAPGRFAEVGFLLIEAGTDGGPYRAREVAGDGVGLEFGFEDFLAVAEDYGRSAVTTAGGWAGQP